MEKTTPEGTADATETRDCPYCAEPIRLAAIKCRWCGSEVEALTSTQPDTQSAAEAAADPATDLPAVAAPDPADEPELSEVDLETDPVATTGGRRRWWVAVAALGIVAVLLGVLLVRLLGGGDADATRATSADAAGVTVSSTGAKQGGLVAATEITQKVLSYGHETLDDDIAATEKLLAGEMADKYATTMSEIKDTTIKNEAEVKATVVASSIISATDHDVRALLFVNQATTGKHLENVRADLNRVIVTLHREGGDWRLTRMDAL